MVGERQLLCTLRHALLELGVKLGEFFLHASPRHHHSSHPASGEDSDAPRQPTRNQDGKQQNALGCRFALPVLIGRHPDLFGLEAQEFVPRSVISVQCRRGLLDHHLGGSVPVFPRQQQMERSLVAINVDGPGFLYSFQQPRLLTGLTTRPEGRNESVDFAAVFRPACQQSVRQLWPLHQENQAGDAAVFTGVAQSVLPQLHFEQAFFERVLRACVHAPHAIQRQISGAQQNDNQHRECQAQASCEPAVFDALVRWPDGLLACVFRQCASSNQAACSAVLNRRDRVALRFFLGQFDFKSHRTSKLASRHRADVLPQLEATTRGAKRGVNFLSEWVTKVHDEPVREQFCFGRVLPSHPA